MKLHVYVAADGIRFRIKAGNGEIVHASDEAFASLEDLKEFLENAKKFCHEGLQTRFYTDTAKEHRWRSVIGSAHEGFKSRTGAHHNAAMVKDFFLQLDVDTDVVLS